jgi:hypothetical protein
MLHVAQFVSSGIGLGGIYLAKLPSGDID